MKRSLRQIVDIINVDKNGTQHVCVPGQCFEYYNSNGYCYKNSVAGLWVYSAVQLTTTSAYMPTVTTLDTVATSNVAGYYMRQITGSQDVLLSSPGGLSMYYSPSARAVMSKVGLWVGCDVEMRRPLTQADFEKVQDAAVDASVVPPTGAPCLFVESNKHTDAIFGAGHAVQMYCAPKKKTVPMHPVAIPPLMQSLSALQKKHITWQTVMWGAALTLQAADFYIGWLPDPTSGIAADKLYTRPEFDATVQTNTSSRLVFEWDDIPPETDITRNVDVLRSLWTQLQQTGYIPSTGIASVL
jgi:hypothetical protein